MSEILENQEVEKEIIIGDYTPKRKFLNFVSVVKSNIRLISDVAFIKGEELSGVLEGTIFKVTICDEGTIKFEEVDTNHTDFDYRKRLIDDICTLDVTGYAQKFVVYGAKFADKDGNLCYLEVEYDKPYDKLMSIFEENKTTEVSEKGRSFLDELLGSDDQILGPIEDSGIDELIEANSDIKKEKEETPKSTAQSMMEDAFNKMNEDKINELKQRVEDKEKDIRKYKVDITQAESNLKQASEQLDIINTRLEEMSPISEPNGYVFFVSDEQKNDFEIDDKTKEIAGKIADLINLKKDVLFDYLTGGFFKIKINKKDTFDKPLEEVDKEILQKVISVDLLGKMSIIANGEFEYRGELTWHQLVSRMIRKGFEQEPEFDKISGSNSYESKEEEVIKKECSHEDCLCDEKSIENKEIDKLSIINNFSEFGKDSKSNKLESKVLMDVKSQKNLYIVGSYNPNKNYDFYITDDESTYQLRIDGKLVENYVNCDGFVNILDGKQLMELIKSAESGENGYDSEFLENYDVISLNNFIGEIRIGAIEDEGYDASIGNRRYGKSTSDFDLSDTIQHQFDDDYAVFIDLPKNTVYQKNDLLNIKSLIRDGKIDLIINK